MNIVRQGANKKRGFTLIELLVVIAIIGILSSVVLVSLNSARKKGTDTRVISDVQETRTALESGYNGAVYGDIWGPASQTAQLFTLPVITSGTGTTTGSANASNMSQVATDAVTEGGSVFMRVTTNSTTGDITHPNVTAYAIYGQLTSNSAQYFCLDSTGGSKQNETSTTTVTCQ